MNASEAQVRLDIGGLGYDLECTDRGLAGWLKARCRYFPAESPKRLNASLNIERGEQTASLLQQPLRFVQGVLTWESPLCRGRIDPWQAWGSLTINSSQPQADAEYFLRAACALFSFENGGLLFHAAGVVRNEKAYLFFGHSGSGKTTVASFSPEGTVLNDDLVLLMPNQGIWWAYPTPFWNAADAPAPSSPAPLVGLYRLKQDRSVFLERMEPGVAVAEMLSNAPLISADASRSRELIQRCQAILAAVPAHALHFQTNDSFWRVISTSP